MTDPEPTEWPREIWMAERDEHDQGRLSAYLSQIGGLADHRYIDADIYASADRYWRERAEKAEAERVRLRHELEAAEALIARLQDGPAVATSGMIALKARSDMIGVLADACDMLSDYGDEMKGCLTLNDGTLDNDPVNAGTVRLIREIEDVIGRADAAIRFWDKAEAEKISVAEVARAILSAYDLSISGQPITNEQRAFGRHIAVAASFAAEAYNQGHCDGQDVSALCRAFLTALADPLSPDLDYLRTDPGAGQAARATAPAQQQREEG